MEKSLFRITHFLLLHKINIFGIMFIYSCIALFNGK